jgi:hypothetical protein
MRHRPSPYRPPSHTIHSPCRSPPRPCFAPPPGKRAAPSSFTVPAAISCHPFPAQVTAEPCHPSASEAGRLTRPRLCPASSPRRRCLSSCVVSATVPRGRNPRRGTAAGGSIVAQRRFIIGRGPAPLRTAPAPTPRERPAESLPASWASVALAGAAVTAMRTPREC